MINTPILRFMRKRGVFGKSYLVHMSNNAIIYVVVYCIMLFMILMALCSFSEISHAQGHLDEIVVNYDELAIKAIIGEAENQGYEGMLGVACAIRNRGNLKSVYGIKSKRVTKVSNRIIQMARTAWVNSDKIDVTNGATGWGNDSDIRIFKKHKWWGKCGITTHIKDHWFYKCN